MTLIYIQKIEVFTVVLLCNISGTSANQCVVYCYTSLYCMIKVYTSIHCSFILLYSNLLHVKHMYYTILTTHYCIFIHMVEQILSLLPTPLLRRRWSMAASHRLPFPLLHSYSSFPLPPRWRRGGRGKEE